MNNCINLFYEEPNPDRWFPFDRYPRQIIRRTVRGKPRPGGVMRWYLNLKKGLDLLGVEYRVNDYRELKRNPNAWACVVGKPQVVDKIPSENPIMYGPGIASHPYDNTFWDKANIQIMLISCEWFREMYKQALPISIPTVTWPAGIETDIWKPPLKKSKFQSLLLYDKVRWRRNDYEDELIEPILSQLKYLGIQVEYFRYGFYEEENYHQILQQVSGMIFLCEHETQGFAYQQALSCDVPILVWDRGGYWQDPSYYPHKVKFEPVSSVPYWSDRCGVKFKDIQEFPEKLEEFLEKLNSQYFAPREYILENLTLEKCAK
jgi:hypothetical protein